MAKTERRKNELKVKNPRLGVIEKINNKISKKWIFITLYIVAYGILYFALRDKLPFTPDFGSSDAFHSNVSFKYYLWQSIRSGILPFWTDKLSGGFPLIAETQIGAFFLPHYLIFPFFFPFSHAYMFLFSFHLLLLSGGMFLLLTLLRVPSTLSFLLAITLTWCGAVSFRWVHFNFLQVFSLAPLLFWTYFKWKGTQNNTYFLFSSFFICQMIFAGHMQTTFIVLLGLILTHLLLNFSLKLKMSISFICSIIFGFILAAPQLFPTILFSHYSQRGLMNMYQYVVYYLFNTNDLIGFYSSKALGSPQDATYGSTSTLGNRIYWENTPYVGELFFILLLLASIYYFITYKKQPLVARFLLLTFLFLLLSLGGDSPLYFLFGIFPFNMFRIPSRYLLISVFFLIIYAALLFKEIIKRKKLFQIFIYCVLVVNCCILILTAFSYHLFIDSQILFKSLNKNMSISSNSNYITFGGNEEWYKKFSTDGWKMRKDIDTYLFINSVLLPNSNLLTELSVFDVYTGGLKMRRGEYLKSVIHGSLIELTHKQTNSKKGIGLENLLQLYNIETIISLKPLYLPHFKPVQTRKKGEITITTYQNINSTDHPEYYVPKTVHKVTQVEEVEDKLYTGTLTQEKSVAESIQKSIVQNPSDANLQIEKKRDSYIKGTITSKESTFIALRKNWYPEWKLYIEGKEQKIYKANLIHIGFFAPKGTHTFELIYVPTSFYFGCAIAFLGIIGVVILFRKYPN